MKNGCGKPGLTKKFAFVTRHAATDDQIEMAIGMGIELVHVGDRDAFTLDPTEFAQPKYDGVIVVYPAAALRCRVFGLNVGIFNNVNRAAVGEKPQFKAESLFIY